VGTLSDVFPYPSESQLRQLYDEAERSPQEVPIELESQLNYPAGVFLLAAPFFWVGIHNFRWIVAIFLFAALAYGFWHTPKKYRLVFIGAALASLELWFSLLKGTTELMVFPFLVAGWCMLPRRPMWALFLIGIAAATKQIAWFFIPFALVFTYSNWGLKRSIQGLAIIIAVFAAFNLPFIVVNPDAWFSSIFAPIKSTFFPIGIGLATMAESGVVGPGSAPFFAAMEAAVFLGSIIWYFFKVRRYPYAGVLLSILPLFFAWRSLFYYFYFIDIILLVFILNEIDRKSLGQIGQTALAANCLKKNLTNVYP
jgi:uncharacterized membrane protein